MIGTIRGTVDFLSADYCILETAGGVGYRVFMPGSHLAQLALGQKLKVQVHTAVREDAIILYGFLNQEAYDLFELLLTVSGIGPKMALGIIAAVKPDAFYLAVQSKDAKALVKLPGVGKKTAERMLLELKDKVGCLSLEAGGKDLFQEAAVTTEASAVAEAMEALNSLGYSNSEILPILKEIPDCSSLTSEELLRQALKLFARRQ